MGGDKGGTRPGRKNEIGTSGFQGGPDVHGGTLGRDQTPKQPKVLLKNGKVQPGTKAFRLQQTKT